MRCELVFKQICWLQERFWPDVDGMGEEDDTARYEGPSFPGANGLGNDGSSLGGGANGNGLSGNGMSNNGMSGSGLSGGPFGGALNGIGDAAGGATN